MPMRFIEARDGYSVYTDEWGERVYRRHMTWLNWRERNHVRWEGTGRYHLTAAMAVDAATTDDLTLDEAQALVSENAADEITTCYKCDDVVVSDDTEHVDENPWCSTCVDTYTNVACDSCSDRVSLDYVTVENGDHCCDHCYMNGNAYYCENHDLYYWADDGCESCADSDCDCESPMPRFSIAGIGGFRYASGEYHEVHADAGIVSEDGYSQIQYEVIEWVTEQYPGVEGHSVYLCDCGEEGEEGEHATHALHYAVRDAARSAVYQTWYADPSYRSESGTTIAKRMRSEIYRRTKSAGQAAPLPAALVAKIGTIARQHSEGADVLVDITRDLNGYADEFVNGDSCWWTDYSFSRCTFKTNAGFGLRTFGDGPDNYATGRAWVFGCTVADDGRLVPTFGDAEAYVVFNGYGDLEEHRGAQVLATLVGWSALTETIRMIAAGDVMYVNSGSARIVAPAEVLARTDLYFSGRGMQRHALLPVPAQV